MSERLVDAYDTRTGDKLPHQVPENYFQIFDHLAKTPRTKAAETAAQKKEAK